MIKMVSASALHDVVIYCATLDKDCVPHYFMYADHAYHYIVDSQAYYDLHDGDAKDRFYDDGIDLATGNLDEAVLAGVGWIERITMEDN